MGYYQNGPTPREREMIDLYNTCGVAYAYIHEKSTFELIDPYADDPNIAYKFKNPNNKVHFIKAVYDMHNALNKFDIYALPDAVFRTYSTKGIVNNYKIWKEDIDILYAVAKREEYLKQIKGNILMITKNLNDYIQRTNLPIESLTRQKAVLILGATILNIRSIIQNEAVIKSIIDMSVTDKNLKFIFEIYSDIKDKLVVTPDNVSLYE